MTIDITITMGEDSKTMGLDEARGLYNELGKLFGSNSGSVIHDPNTYNPSHQHQPSVAVNKEPIPEGNPKVEAAKDRAEQRTRGCGARRTK